MIAEVLAGLVVLHTAAPKAPDLVHAAVHAATRVDAPVRDRLRPSQTIAWQLAQASGPLPADQMAQPADGAGDDRDGLLQAEQKRSASLVEKLTDLQRSTTAQINRLQQQLENEQAQAASRELAAARELLAQSERTRAPEDAAHQAAEASIKERDAKLQDEQKRSAALAQQVADLQRTTPAQLDALKAQLAEERGRAATASRDLVATRDQLSQLTQDRSRETAAREAIEASVKERDAKLQDERKRSAALAQQMADLQRTTPAQLDALKAQLAEERDRAAAASRDLTATRGQLSQLTQDRSRETAARQAVEASTKEREAKLQDEQKRSAILAQQIADLQRTMPVQLNALKTQLTEERGRVAAGSRDLAAANDQLNQLAQDRSRETAARQALDAKVESGTKTLQTTATQLDEFKKQRADQQAQAATRERELLSLREQLAQAVQNRTSGDQERLSSQAALEGKDLKVRAGQRRISDLTAELAQAKQAAAAQILALTKQVAEGQAQSVGRGQDAASQLAQLRDERTREAAARTAAEAALRDSGGKLRAAQGEAAASVDQLTRAQRDAGVKLAELQKRIDGERLKAETANNDAAAVRQQLAQATRAGVEAVQARRTAEAAVKEGDAKLQTERRQVAALTQRLAEAGRKETAEVETLTAQAAAERTRSSAATRLVDKAPSANASRSASSEREPLPTRPGHVDAASGKRGDEIAPKQQMNDAALQGNPASASSARASASVSPSVASTAVTDAGLPSGVAAHVVLRYRRANDAARRHAMTLLSTLQARGLDVAGPVEARQGKGDSQVVYFYGEDRSAAQDVAEALSTSARVASRRASNPLPRPGTIEVLVGG